jgi:hypothetical protein
MGCFVDESVCTVCGNKARDVTDYCEHVRYHKGALMKISAHSPLVAMGRNTGEDAVVGELNFGVTFFELSDITTQAALGGGGADPDAKILERLAMRNPSGWESLLVHRTGGAVPQARKAPGQNADPVRIHARAEQEVRTMSMKHQKTGQENLTPTVIGDPAKITQEKTPSDYPHGGGSADPDATLLDQSQKGAPADLDANVIGDEDKLSQKPSEDDYPQGSEKGKAGGRRRADYIPTASDPANMVGGKPDEVQAAEDAERTKNFEDVKEKLSPGDAADTETEMHEEMEEERDDMVGKMEAALKIISKRARKSEKVAQKLDEFNDSLSTAMALRKRAKEARSKTHTAGYNARAERFLRWASMKIREVLAYGDTVDGKANQQPLVDAEGYEQGNPDGALLDESQGKSDKADSQNLIPSDEDVAQVERPDRPHEGDGKTGRLVITGADDMDKAVDEMTERLARGEDFETVQDEVFNRYGKPDGHLSNRAKRKVSQGLPPEVEGPEGEIPGKPKGKPEMPNGPKGIPEMPETPEMPEKGACDDTRPLKRGQTEDALNPNAGDSKSDLSLGADAGAANDAAIKPGTSRTKAGPQTRKITDTGSELIQLSARRRAMLARTRLAQGEDPEKRLDQGTEKTKASPSTMEISDGQNAFQEEKTKAETSGQSATPAPPKLSSGAQLMAFAYRRLKTKFADAVKTNARLREQNERYALRAQEIERSWKWQQCVKIAKSMAYKGFFQDAAQAELRRGVKDKTGTALTLAQIHDRLAYKEASEMMRMSIDEIETQGKLVARAQKPERQVPRWSRSVTMPHRDAVSRPHVVPSNAVTAARGDELGEGLFVDDPNVGF